MQSISVSRYLLPALAVFATFFIVGKAYPNGAPAPAACAGAQPIHATNGSLVQPLNPANNPYSFTLEVEEYIPGQDLEVTIEEASGGMVNGFFLQARRTDTGVPVGTFQDPLPTGAQLRQCTSARDSVTHTNPDGKTGLTFTWRAPAADTGEVEFVGAVALDHDNFYGGMKSSVLAEGNGMTIEGANDASFQGFFLQARRTSDDTPVGTFTAPDASIGKLLECTNAGDTITHANDNNKTEQTFTWHAPDAGMGEVQFFGTVAVNHDRFFVNITSEALTEGEPVTMGPTTTGEMTTGNAIKLSSGFGFLLLAAVMAMLQINSFA